MKTLIVNMMGAGLDCSIERYTIDGLPSLKKNQSIVGYILVQSDEEPMSHLVRRDGWENTNESDWGSALLFPELTDALLEVWHLKQTPPTSINLMAVVRTVHTIDAAL